MDINSCGIGLRSLAMVLSAVAAKTGNNVSFRVGCVKFARARPTYFARAQSYYLYNQKFRMGGNA